MINKSFYKARAVSCLIFLFLICFSTSSFAAFFITTNSSASTATLREEVTVSVTSPDAAGNIYIWQHVSGPGITITQSDSAGGNDWASQSITFTPNGIGTIQLQAYVEDSDGNNNTSLPLSIEVSASAPVVNITQTGPVTLYPGQSEILNATGNTDDGGNPTYTWRVVNNVSSTLAPTSGDTTTFTAPTSVTSETEYLVEVEAKDPTNQSGFDTATAQITVIVKTKTAPEFDVIATDAAGSTTAHTEIVIDPANAAPFYLRALNVEDADDAAGPVGPFTYSWAPVGAAPAITSGQTSATATVDTGAVATETTYTYEVTVTDNDTPGESTTKSVSITLVPYQPPVVNPNGPNFEMLDTDPAVELQTNPTDPDGVPSTFTYTWSDTCNPGAVTTQNYDFTPPPHNGTTARTCTVTVTVDDGDPTENTSPQVFTITVNDADLVPGADFTFDPATGPYDEDKAILLVEDVNNRAGCPANQMTYEWDISPIDTVTVLPTVAQDGSEYRFKARVIEPGRDFDITMTVTDCHGNSDAVTKTIRVDNVASLNSKPNADAGPDDQIDAGDSYRLNGSASSDPDGASDIQNGFMWTQVNGVTVNLVGETLERPTFRAPSEDTTLTFKLTVTDKDNASDSDTVIINVSNANTPPVAVAKYSPNSTRFGPGETITLDSSDSTDAEDGSNLSVQWQPQFTTPSISLSTFSSEARFTAPTGYTGTLEFELTVTDSEGAQDSATVFVNVGASGEGPIANPRYNNVNGGTAIKEGDTVELNGAGSSDPDGGNIVSYQWRQISGPAVVFDDSELNQGIVRFIAPQVGSNNVVSFELIVEDNDGFKDAEKVTFEIADNGVSNIDDGYVSAKPILDDNVIGASPNRAVGFRVVSGGELVYLRGVDPSEYSSISVRPQTMPFGMWEFRVKTDSVGGTAVVEIMLSEPASEDSKYYKFNAVQNKFYEFEDDNGNTGDSLFKDPDTRRVLQFTVRDGGPTDEISRADGYVVDPSGLAIPGTVTVTTGGSDNVLGGGGALGLLGLAGLFWVGRRRITASACQNQLLH